MKVRVPFDLTFTKVKCSIINIPALSNDVGVEYTVNYDDGMNIRAFRYIDRYRLASIV